MTNSNFPYWSFGLLVINTIGPVIVGKAIPGNDKGDSTKITAFPVLGILLIATGNWDPDWFEIEPNHEERMPAASNVVLLGFVVKIKGKTSFLESFLLANGIGKFASSFGRVKGKVVTLSVL